MGVEPALAALAIGAGGDALDADSQGNRACRASGTSSRMSAPSAFWICQFGSRIGLPASLASRR